MRYDRWLNLLVRAVGATSIGQSVGRHFSYFYWLVRGAAVEESPLSPGESYWSVLLPLKQNSLGSR